eukprot:2616415-Pleurochrysis_carterae.AAC.3
MSEQAAVSEVRDTGEGSGAGSGAGSGVVGGSNHGEQSGQDNDSGGGDGGVFIEMSDGAMVTGEVGGAKRVSATVVAFGNGGETHPPSRIATAPSRDVTVGTVQICYFEHTIVEAANEGGQP